MQEPPVSGPGAQALPGPGMPSMLDGRPIDDRGPMVVAVCWTLTALASVFLALRLYCKYVSRRALWWDDWILIGAWVMLVSEDIITTILKNEFKIGRHAWDMEIKDFVRMTILLGARATTTIVAIVWTKTAFAITLLRLTEGKVRLVCWFIIVSLSIAMGFSAAVPWISCTPVQKSWDRSVPGTCWGGDNVIKIWVGTGAYSAAMDFVLAALPWTIIMKLKMRRKEKIGVGIAMSMGVVAGIVAVVKSVKLPNLNTGDPYDAIDLFIWDIAESTTTMIAACIPNLRVLVRDVKTNPSLYFRSTNKSNPFTPVALVPSHKQLSSDRSQSSQFRDVES